MVVIGSLFGVMQPTQSVPKWLGLLSMQQALIRKQT